MADRHASGTRLITLYMKVSLIEAIDEALERAHYSDRSLFIRDAVYEKLTIGLGIPLPHSITLAPGRKGVGGRKRPDSFSSTALGASMPEASTRDLQAEAGLPPKRALTPSVGVPSAGTALPKAADQRRLSRPLFPPAPAPK